MNRRDWLENLRPGDLVIYTRNGRGAREMRVSVIGDAHLLLTDAVGGERVWLDTGEGPFGERVDPVDQEILPAIGGDARDSFVGGWEAA